MRYVLDASAALAWLNFEPGGDRVAGVLDDAIISAVNLVEVGTRLLDSGGTKEQVTETLGLLSVSIADFDAGLADAAIDLRTRTKAAGLSLADRACLALAMREGATALTADRAWARLDLGCEVELIR